ncbi:MAG TPA: peptidylprolyl isomerase [Polyangiaceae bacterium]
MSASEVPATRRGRRIWARWVREPLVHFLLLGALLFAAQAWRERTAATHGRTILLTKATKVDLAREFEARAGRPPTAAELSAAIEGFRREEALYQEGLRQRLDRNDPQVRERVVTKLLELQRGLFVPPQPTARQLDEFLERHRARYEVPERYDFEHVFVARASRDAKGRAQALLDELRRGGPARDLGDPFASGREFAAQTPERLSRVFGAEFAAALPRLIPGTWTLVESQHGVHLVKLRLAEGGLPARETLGPRLIEDYQRAAEEAALAAYVTELTARFSLVEVP